MIAYADFESSSVALLNRLVDLAQMWYQRYCCW